MAIDVGAGAISRGASAGVGYTYCDRNNPANATGVVNTVELWFEATGIGTTVGIMYNTSGYSYNTRSSIYVGSVTAGSKQTFSGLILDVRVGDVVAIYTDTNAGVSYDAGGSIGILYRQYNGIGGGIVFDLSSSLRLSIYGTSNDPAVDIGSGAVAFGLSGGAGYTYVDQHNKANANGVINIWEFYFVTNATGVCVGVMYLASGIVWNTRSYSNIGNVSSGSKQTFSGFDCLVHSGDSIAFYTDTGAINCDANGLVQCMSSQYNMIPGGGAALYAAGLLRISAYGYTTPIGWVVGNICGNLYGMDKFWGVLKTGISKIMGV
jgi:hypothetical protein